MTLWMLPDHLAGSVLNFWMMKDARSFYSRFCIEMVHGVLNVTAG